MSKNNINKTSPAKISIPYFRTPRKPTTWVFKSCQIKTPSLCPSTQAWVDEVNVECSLVQCASSDLIGCALDLRKDINHLVREPTKTPGTKDRGFSRLVLCRDLPLLMFCGDLPARHGSMAPGRVAGPYLPTAQKLRSRWNYCSNNWEEAALAY